MTRKIIATLAVSTLLATGAIAQETGTPATTTPPATTAPADTTPMAPADTTPMAPADTAPAAPVTPMAPDAGTATTTTAPAAETSARPADLMPITGAELTADKLMGTTVYGPDDSSLGRVGDIALTADGTVDAIIVDVGGFLGIGSKPVAVAMDNLQFQQDSGGSLYVTTDFTREELDAAPEYDSETYSTNRDTMRIESGTVTP
ncbi:PRC-barrel domain-containing protein [Aureimonas fodinaquatilis]|nr:PRC-barrel domain-containing protein [Aureimonas fodinaquatilis]